MAIEDQRLFERVQDLIRRVAILVAGYRRDLEQTGMPRDEAWVLAQKVESRLLDPIFDAAEADSFDRYDVEREFAAGVRSN